MRPRKWGRRRKRRMVGGGGGGGGCGMLSKGKKVEVCTEQSCRKQNIQKGESKSLYERNRFISKQQCASHFS